MVLLAAVALITVLASAGPASAQDTGITVDSTMGFADAAATSPPDSDSDTKSNFDLFTSFNETATASASGSEGTGSATGDAAGSLTGGFDDLTGVTSSGGADADFNDVNPDQNGVNINVNGQGQFGVDFDVPEPGVSFSLIGSVSTSSSDASSPCSRAMVSLGSTEFEADSGNGCGGSETVPVSASGILAPGEQSIEAVASASQSTKLGSSGENADANWSFTLSLEPLANCPDVRVGFAIAKGCFTETAPGSGIFETEERAWVGGFEIQPRPGGALVLDTGARSVSESGAGVGVIFAGFAVPIPVSLLPVGVQDGTLEIGVAGTATGVLGIPVESTVKVAWSGGGRSATYEQSVKVKELTSGIGELVTLSAGESVGAGSGKLKAKLENGVGFVLQSGEISIDEVNVIPRRLKVPRTLKLKNLLLKFEIKNGKPFWTGRAGIGLPLSRGRRLDVTGTGFAFDGSLVGGGLEVGGINTRVLGPLFLQRVGGDLLFAPDFGFDLRAGATVGPQVGPAKLVSLDGTIQAGSVVAGCADTAARPDPNKLEAKAKLSPLEGLEEAGLANVNITQRACIYPGTGDAAAAIEGTLDGELTLLGAFGYKGVQTGFISTAGASYEGSVLVRIPGLPDPDGSAILSTVGVAACTDLGFFEGGIGYAFGSGAPSGFAGCDLGPFRVLQATAARGASIATPGALGSSRAATTLRLPAGLPHAGFAAKGTAGPPPVTVSGPGGFSVTSPADGSALRSPKAVVIPVAAESTTYVFVDDPKAGSWSVDSLDPDNPLTEVGLSEGLEQPKVKGKVGKRKAKGKKGGAKNAKRLTLAYSLRKIPGQKVILTERGEGIANELGKAKGKRGRIAFKPTLAADRRRTIEAEVIQDGMPREILTIARFKAPPLPKLKVSKLKAKRKKSSLVASWAKVAGSSEFLVELQSGNEVLFRVLTAKRRLRFATPAKGKLKLSVQALSESRPPGPVAKLAVKPAKGKKDR